jgi:hypothetical protein
VVRGWRWIAVDSRLLVALHSHACRWTEPQSSLSCRGQVWLVLDDIGRGKRLKKEAGNVIGRMRVVFGRLKPRAASLSLSFFPTAEPRLVSFCCFFPSNVCCCIPLARVNGEADPSGLRVIARHRYITPADLEARHHRHPSGVYAPQPPYPHLPHAMLHKLYKPNPSPSIPTQTRGSLFYLC